jgi:hypothetical protein
MLRWLWKIIVGKKPAPPCTRECQWEIHDQGKLWSEVGGAKTYTGLIYILRCKTCGDMKNHLSEG